MTGACLAGAASWSYSHSEQQGGAIHTRSSKEQFTLRPTRWSNSHSEKIICIGEKHACACAPTHPHKHPHTQTLTHTHTHKHVQTQQLESGNAAQRQNKANIKPRLTNLKMLSIKLSPSEQRLPGNKNKTHNVC